MNNNQTKKPFDYEQFNQDLNSLRIHLEHRSWTFQTNNYRDFLILQEEEKDLFVWANKLGIQGVTAYIDAQREALDDTLRERVARAVKQNESGWKSRVDFLEKRVEELRTKLPAVERYKEELERHDWFYSYSDDGSVWRNGDRRRKELIQMAKEGGKELQDALVAKWDAVYKTTGTIWEALLKKA